MIDHEKKAAGIATLFPFSSIVLLIALSSCYGENSGSVDAEKERHFSLKNNTIESISAFGIGGISTMVYVSSHARTSNNSMAEIAQNSLITYSTGNILGAYASALLLRNRIAIKPLLYSSVGCLIGMSTGYFIAERNVKAGEYTTLFLVPLLSGLGAELAFYF